MKDLVSKAKELLSETTEAVDTDEVSEMMEESLSIVEDVLGSFNLLSKQAKSALDDVLKKVEDIIK